MAFTVNTAIELVIHRGTGGRGLNSDVKSKWHPEIIKQYIINALEQLIGDRQPALQSFSDLGQLNTMITAYPDISFSEDTARKIHYINMPAKPISLYFNRGVHSISYMTEPETEFVYMENDRTFMCKNLPSGRTVMKGRYFIEGNKIFFPTTYITPTAKLLVKLLTFDSLTAESDISLFAGKQSEFLDMVFRMLASSEPQDKIINRELEQPNIASK